MKTKEEKHHKNKLMRAEMYGKRGYYFHADEDFREDPDWGKNKLNTLKSVSKRVGQFEL